DHRKPRQYRTEAKCRAKQYFADEVLARAVAHERLQNGSDVRKLWVYRCKYCPGWHITSSNAGPERLVTAESPA
ncbi:MAG TPA: hypothetical protein VFV90_00775, partial [Usitatibacter sp.]|nr:hypothetical protein [Usitatibacter sp.]